ncbi:hypothetical protein GAY28_30965 [Azospirillum brasilense]|nr:hypothetical protein [Azospirillum brasilense]
MRFFIDLDQLFPDNLLKPVLVLGFSLLFAAIVLLVFIGGPYFLIAANQPVAAIIHVMLLLGLLFAFKQKHRKAFFGFMASIIGIFFFSLSSQPEGRPSYDPADVSAAETAEDYTVAVLKHMKLYNKNPLAWQQGSPNDLSDGQLKEFMTFYTNRAANSFVNVISDDPAKMKEQRFAFICQPLLLAQATIIARKQNAEQKVGWLGAYDTNDVKDQERAHPSNRWLQEAKYKTSIYNSELPAAYRPLVEAMAAGGGNTKIAACAKRFLEASQTSRVIGFQNS